jgi:exoribonuclease R
MFQDRIRVDLLTMRQYVDVWEDQVGGHVAYLQKQVEALQKAHVERQAGKMKTTKGASSIREGAATMQARAADILHGTAEYEYLSAAQCEQGMLSGTMLQSTLKVRNHSPNEAYVEVDVSNVKKAVLASFGTEGIAALELVLDRNTRSSLQIHIPDRGAMNRTMHGDKVFVCLVHPSMWTAPLGRRRLVHTSHASGEDEPFQKTAEGTGVKPPQHPSAMATQSVTGVVLGLESRECEEMVATIDPHTSSSIADSQAGATAIRSRPSSSSEGGAGSEVSKTEAVLVIPLDVRFPKVRVRTSQALLLTGMRVIIRVDKWDTGSQYPDGHYVRAIGPVGTLDAEVEALLVTHRALPYPFSASAQACLPDMTATDVISGGEITAATSALIDWVPPPEDVSQRRDLRAAGSGHQRVFSVDPPGCQDIDDAMSVDLSTDGSKYYVGVHIADVTHFVKANSALDKEAAQRATTIYLNDRRFDMLPKILSGDLCSLHGNKDRFAVTTIFEVDAKTFVVNKTPESIWFGRSVIKSVAAMTYEQGHRMLQGKPPDHPKAVPPPGGQAGGPVPQELRKDIRKDLEVLTQVARVQKQRRTQAGSVSFVKWDDCNILLNDNREPVALEMEEHLEIHDTVAELMILANSAVATRIFNEHPSAALLRRHTAPNQERFEDLRELTQGKEKTSGLNTRTNKALEKSLEVIRQRATKDVVAATTAMAITAMSEAEYICSGEAEVQKEHFDHLESQMQDSKPGDAAGTTMKPFEHYGLGLQFYTHFTSPIRRYADVMVHRLLLNDADAAKPELASSSKRGAAPTTALPVSLALSTVEKYSRSSMVEDPAEAAKRNYEGTIVAKVPAAPGLLQVPSLEYGAIIDDSQRAFETLAIAESRSATPSNGDGRGEKPRFSAANVEALCKHLNARNRRAKTISRECNHVFLSVYLSRHPVTMGAVIVKLKSNGFLAYLPILDYTLPVHLCDVEGMVHLGALKRKGWGFLQNLATVPPSQNFTDLGADVDVQGFPQVSVELKDEDEAESVLHLIARGGKPKKVFEFKVFDQIQVHLSCRISQESPRISKPKAIFLEFQEVPDKLETAQGLKNDNGRFKAPKDATAVKPDPKAAANTIKQQNRMQKGEGPSLHVSLNDLQHICEQREREERNRSEKEVAGAAVTTAKTKMNVKKVGDKGARLLFNDFARTPATRKGWLGAVNDTDKVKERHDAMALPNILSMSDAEKKRYAAKNDVRNMEAGAMARTKRLQAQKRQSKLKK